MNLLGELNLPLDERGQKRAAAQAEWITSSRAPIEVHEIIAE
jgi:hypothetical protein